ncbi:hypothetical protein B0I35DRAFT_484033 [Stachybotrys elegans]|uniref:Uncharacterized protein n=1 Tax=Stachybotrys elegans TaxID=80388 RepID=A0A8K0SK03_9HYPO|nr:hypothetical protein B0I35DRAFT_484033 [Stachybotrys elegans]
MLLITLTVGASSETPYIKQNEQSFNVAPKRKEPAQLALAMATRMMWHLYRPFFPWAKGSGGSACNVGEMAKKIEQAGCSNRMLQKLGWVMVKGTQDSPWNTDFNLRPKEELLSELQSLRRAMKKEPQLFIKSIFRSNDDLWVERCQRIITGMDPE